MREEAAPYQREPLKPAPTPNPEEDRMDLLRRTLAIILDNVAILASGLFQGMNNSSDMQLVFQFVKYLKTVWDHVQELAYPPLPTTIE